MLTPLEYRGRSGRQKTVNPSDSVTLASLVLKHGYNVLLTLINYRDSATSGSELCGPGIYPNATGASMDQPSIFSATLGLAYPWQISRVEISTEQPRLDIYIVFEQSLSMTCPSCGSDATICGMSEQSWHHGDFFKKEAFLHVAMPMLRCDAECGCIKTPVPWSSASSRFILREDPLLPACASCTRSGKAFIPDPNS